MANQDSQNWKALGLPAKFLPSCADSALKPVKPEQVFASDVAFIGSGYDPSRAAFLLKVANKYDLKVWGRGWKQLKKPLSKRRIAPARIAPEVDVNFDRLSRFAGERVWEAHRQHFYQRATTRGLTVYAVVSRVFLVNFLLAVLAVINVWAGSASVSAVVLIIGAALVGLLLWSFQREKNAAAV